MFNYLFSFLLPAIENIITVEAKNAINWLTGIFTKASVDLGATDAIIATSNQAIEQEIVILSQIGGTIDAILANFESLVKAMQAGNYKEQAQMLTALESDITKTTAIWTEQETLIKSYLASMLKEILIIKNTGI